MAKPHKVIVTRYIKETVELDDDEIKHYIIGARVNVPGELDLYAASPQAGLMQRVATIAAPSSCLVDHSDGDALLEYARNHLPAGLRIDLT